MLTPKRSNAPLFMWLSYVFFVVYGSLVPLNYQPHSFEEAWRAFQHIPFLNLGVGSRADWISNGVLYVPVGFLSAYLLTQSFHRVRRLFMFVIATVFSVGLAVTVEFVQYYFPPRTVSLNDILAEGIGSVIGITLAAIRVNWFHALFESLVGDSRRLRTLALEAYAFGYIAFALFPYDFLLSLPELSDKINSNSWGWFIAADSPRFALVVIQLTVETALCLPFGFLLARLLDRKPATYKLVFSIGLLLGLSLELVQFAIYTGTSQGLSVLTRALGVTVGLHLSQRSASWPLKRITGLLVRLTPALIAAYALALLEINGFLTTQWRSWAEATAQIPATYFIPFYYHYFTSEARALFSLGVVALSYSPIALLVWAGGRSARFALGVALAVSALIELGKLFLQSQHPDPTNLIIACAASWGSVRLLQQLTTPHISAPKLSDSPSQPVNTESDNTALIHPRQSIPPWVMLCLAAAGLWVVTFPGLPWLVGLVLAMGAALVWYRHIWVFAVIAAALPVFDLAPWSGRFFWDEFDTLLAVCLSLAFALAPPPLPAKAGMFTDKLGTTLMALLTLSFAISTMRGLMPFSWPDTNAFNSYYSSYNALRIAKGFIWALLAYALFRRFVAAGQDPRCSFAWGITIGLALTVVVILWERLAFSSLLNFSDGYRVTGPFSATNTGGAYVDCFLAAGTPFLISLLLEKRHMLIRLVLLLLLVAVTYSLMVTFSRGGYLSFAVSTVIMLLVSLLGSKGLLRRGLFATGLVMILLAVAVPIYKADFLQSRVSTVSTDMSFRRAQWADALAIRDPGWATELFGMGVGRFPATKYWRSTLSPRAGNYQLVHEAGNTFLRLDSGDPIGLEQFVSLEPGQSYVLKMDVRPSRPGAKIVVPICEKWLLTSATCIAPTVDLGETFATWRSVEARFTNNDIQASPWYGHRPVKLALTYGVPESTVDIDNVRLETAQGFPLLQNSDFSAGLDHWFFATAGALHSHWRVHSLFYGVLFDQGWLGLFAFGAVVLLALARAAKMAWNGNRQACASFAAIGGLLVGGIFDNPLDAPRFLLLLFFLVWSDS